MEETRHIRLSVNLIRDNKTIDNSEKIKQLTSALEYCEGKPALRKEKCHIKNMIKKLQS